MLPLPMIPTDRSSTLRSWLARVDSHTLWAFNAQPALARRRFPQAEQAGYRGI